MKNLVILSCYFTFKLFLGVSCLMLFFRVYCLEDDRVDLRIHICELGITDVDEKLGDTAIY